MLVTKSNVALIFVLVTQAIAKPIASPVCIWRSRHTGKLTHVVQKLGDSLDVDGHDVKCHLIGRAARYELMLPV